MSAVVYRYGTRRKPVMGLSGRIVMLVVGLMIGASVGMYVALRTLPLPETTYIYSLK